MASEDMGLVPPQRLDTNGLTSQMVFQQEGLRFNSRPVADPSPKTRELSGFIDDRYFQSQGAAADFRRSLYVDDGNRLGQSLNGNGQGGGEGSEGDEEEEDDDDDEEDDEEDDMEEREVGSSRGLMHSGNDNSNARATVNGNHQQGRSNQYHNAVTIADANGDLYYSQYPHGLEGSGSGQKGVGVENGCGGSGRKEGSYSTESGESLRMILSDPLTGALMDDAIILPCGHSFGGGGVQQVLRNKACCTCSHPVSEESVSPNLSLRAAVQAFRREEELNVYRSSKRRRDRFEQVCISMTPTPKLYYPNPCCSF
ncbi:U-box domain-containing protein 62 isoform X2 [Rhododendron vialii]|uniref:U-box domain-containing protein 62 isoform X2 n=1 Tax=Rhododendron vialii TaxID=182163 RepID=UPI00265F9320|nr:U-box domain-containing protein 62 isoform X2 [Rhododendron vialii]